jgi:acetylornithine/N-succinyldiaminopimelate aminotransferase
VQTTPTPHSAAKAEQTPAAPRTQNELWMEKAKAHLLQNYKQQPICLVRGKGSRVWDADGKEYLDLLGGIATCALGHCHPEVVSAVKAQLDTLWHVSNVFYSEPSIELAAQLTTLSGLPRAFFCNSGAEANEALIKLARKVMKDRGTPARFEIICFENSFHGRTLATVTATGQPKYQKGFEPLPPGFVHVPYGDLEAVRKVVGPSTAAILVEPIQGEGGVRAAPPGFLKALRELCDRYGMLLVADEVQTGMGRTGKLFAVEHWDVVPDIICLAKGIASGLPLGAIIARGDVMDWPPGSHASTFGGNPVSCRAALATIELLLKEYLANAAQRGEQLRQGLLRLGRRAAQLGEVRGLGLMTVVDIVRDRAGQILDPGLRDEIIQSAFRKGLLLLGCGEGGIRFCPPLCITAEQIDTALRLLADVIPAATPVSAAAGS